VKTRILISAALLSLTAAAGALVAQAPADPLAAGAKQSFGIVKGYITKAAAKMPEDSYGFKATPDVRSFGQIVGHIADANFHICAAALGEKSPMGEASVEKTKTTKADLEKALAESYAYCDKAHAAMTDKAGAATVKFFGGDTAKLSVLEFNTHHNFEHYGNLVTYMRLKGLVPPSSEGR
jgi:uncharacterized damage-inducible protein DinB